VFDGDYTNLESQIRLSMASLWGGISRSIHCLEANRNNDTQSESSLVRSRQFSIPESASLKTNVRPFYGNLYKQFRDLPCQSPIIGTSDGTIDAPANSWRKHTIVGDPLIEGTAELVLLIPIRFRS
jgi:hypothetical protein